MRRLIVVVAAALTCGAAAAQGQKCDCTKIVATCSATLEVTDPKGQSPNYSAGLKIRTSAANCARVEYFIDSTPHQTLISSGSIAFESIFGTSPVSQTNVSFENCRVCAFASASPKVDDSPAQDKKPDLTAILQGTWCWSHGITRGKNTFSGNSVRVEASALGFPGSNHGTFTPLNERQFRITLTNQVQNVELLDNNSIKWDNGVVAQRCGG